jgi:acyl-CoA synthetase (AMP-forming)/AMP-acid ligase II
MPDPRWSEVGVAVCVPAARRSLEEQELRTWLEPPLARYKVPKKFVMWDTLRPIQNACL